MAHTEVQAWMVPASLSCLTALLHSHKVMQWLAQPGPTQLPELSTALARLMEAGQVDCVQGLVEALQLQPGQTVLEIGFGTGHALQLAAQREPGAHLYGVDISQTSLELCQQRLGKAGLSDSVKLQLADVARQLPFAADTFDTIYHLNCIYFWQPLQRGLAECLRVLKPGGRMVTGFKATSIAQGLNFDVDGADSDKGPFRHVQENRVLEDIAAAGFIQTGVLRRDDFDFFGRRYQLFFHQKPASS